MEHNYQYSVAKEIQISRCDRTDGEGCCEEYKTISENGREEKYSCESLVKQGSCPR